MQALPQVIGFCFEGTENAVAGAATGPAMMRWGYQSTEFYSLLQDAETPEFDDFGDRYFHGLYGREACDAMQYALASELRKGPYLLLGGDHLVSLPSIEFLVEQRGIKPWVVHLDAHLDRYDTYHGSDYAHCTVFQRIEDLIGPERVRSFGVRTRAVEEPWDPDRFHKFDVLEPLKAFLENEAKDGPIYLSFDLDVLSPGDVPAVSNPEPGGIDIREAVAALSLMRGRLVAADLVELVPTKCSPAGSAQVAGVVFREILVALGATAQ